VIRFLPIMAQCFSAECGHGCEATVERNDTRVTASTMTTIIAELYDALRDVGATDEKARAAAVVRNDAKIDARLAHIEMDLTHLEKDLKRIQRRVTAVLLLLVGGGVVAACFLLLGQKFFEDIWRLTNL
jgi:hypothetical protein